MPKLILQITFDQLRGDMLASAHDRLGKGGFRHLYENGVVYQNTHHRHAKPVFMEVQIVDIAVPLSTYLSSKVPSGATEEVLVEVLSE